MARLKDLGHEVHGLSFTDGQIGYSLKDKTPLEVGEMRRNEMLAASRILGYAPHFAGHMDGSLCAGPHEVESFRSFLEELSPDIIFSHWPVDTHPDHRASAAIALQAWLKFKGREAFYYYEVMTGRQTHCFNPVLYVDIAKYEEMKFKAYLSHRSQNLSREFGLKQHRKRGGDVGRACCEAFIPFADSASPKMLFE